jgi:hypothetical protein
VKTHNSPTDDGIPVGFRAAKLDNGWHESVEEDSYTGEYEVLTMKKQCISINLKHNLSNI